VLCTVEKISGTVVFVTIHLPGQDLEGSIILSEIAPGRIRNLRAYVVPKKKIVCKVLRVSGDRIDVSLRRVSQKEKKEVLDQQKQEQSCKSVLKSVLGEMAKDIIGEISKKESLYNFCERIKGDTCELEKLTSKENSKKIQDILKTQKTKTCTIKKEFILNSSAPDGLTKIKKILGEIKNVEVNYISAGKYTLKAESDNLKTADNLLKTVLEEMEKKTKKQGLNFSVKEK